MGYILDYIAYYYMVYLAFSVPTAGADEAALLIDEQVTTVRALPGQILSQSVVLRFRLAIITSGMFLQHAGNSISAGENRFALFPSNRWTADTPELPYHLGHIYPRP